MQEKSEKRNADIRQSGKTGLNESSLDSGDSENLAESSEPAKDSVSKNKLNHTTQIPKFQQERLAKLQSNEPSSSKNLQKTGKGKLRFKFRNKKADAGSKKQQVSDQMSDQISDQTFEPSKPAKKRKYRFTTKGLVVLIMLCGIAAIAVSVFLSQPSAIDRLSLTYLDDLSTKDLTYTIPDSYDEAYEISDYTIYGESLTLYADEYGADEVDPLYGKVAVLKNIETGQELSFTFTGGADGGITLGDLQPGVYEIYVYDSYTKKRVYMAESTEAPEFYTMRRNKEITVADLDAKSDYLKRFGINQDQNYLYLTVTSSLPKVKIVDVIIDPSGMETFLNTGTSSPGYVSDLINEASASYQFATEIQQILEQQGLRVELSRTSNESSGYFGANSRVENGYKKQAKVFLSVGMGAGDENRPYIYSSPYTNGSLANTVAHVLEADGIELSDVSDNSMNDHGTAFDPLIVSDDYQYTVWSSYPQLRETGGIVTHTGTGDNWVANEDYQDYYGMYGLLFFYASDGSEDSQTYFLTNEGTMAQGIANGILEYFNIPQKTEIQNQDSALPSDSGQSVLPAENPADPSAETAEANQTVLQSEETADPSAELENPDPAADDPENTDLADTDEIPAQ